MVEVRISHSPSTDVEADFKYSNGVKDSAKDTSTGHGFEYVKEIMTPTVGR